MMDIVYVGLLFGFVILTTAVTTGCLRLQRAEECDMEPLWLIALAATLAGGLLLYLLYALLAVEDFE